MKPSREQLEEEFAYELSQYTKQNTIREILICCEMSQKYKIDIRRLLWNLTGKPKDYSKIFDLCDTYGVSYYIT